ncbi:MAG TPA: hypothetical protein VFD01_16050 [Candidatus Dormibacteraeota bacterium]|jgi:hypothetical protein|nr:hypothetical protein [Candidatus Dormibacteraeota bacterium]
MSPAPGADPDGLPLFPPLPGGRVVEPTARSLVRLVAGLRTAVLTVSAATAEAMVVFLDHEPIHGLAVRGDRRLVGPEALDEIAGEPIQRATVTEVDPELARVLGSYLLPTELRVPARLVVPEVFIRGLARPDQQGCVIVRGGDATGLVFLGGGRVLLAYRPGGVVGGFEQVAPIFAEPEARLWARLGPAPAAVDLEAAPGGPREAGRPEDGAADRQGTPPPAAPPRPLAPPAVEVPPSPVEVPGPTPLEQVLDAVREVLGPHSVRVEPALRAAGSDLQRLRLAAESLRQRRPRLLSRATMARAADRALAALAEAEAGPRPR